MVLHPTLQPVGSHGPVLLKHIYQSSVVSMEKRELAGTLGGRAAMLRTKQKKTGPLLCRGPALNSLLPARQRSGVIDQADFRVTRLATPGSSEFFSTQCFLPSVVTSHFQNGALSFR